MGDRPNIVFVVMDTVRADQLDVYGGSVKTSAIKGMAKKGLVYNQAIAPGTYTVPSHISMFLGKRARDVGTIMTNQFKYSEKFTDPLRKKNVFIKRGEMTLARKLSYLGYSTALFSNNPFLSETTGLAEGFSHVEDLWFKNNIESSKKKVKFVLNLIQNDITRRHLIDLAYSISFMLPRSVVDSMYINLRKKLDRHFSVDSKFYNMDKGAEVTNAMVDSYLEGQNPNNQFIFLNYMEAHEGYPTNLITDEYVEQDKWLYLSKIESAEKVDYIRRAYGLRIKYLDKKIKGLLDILRKRGILENAVVILTSDHGQAFMEHEDMYHNMFPYSEVSRVPLIIGRYVSGKQVGTAETVDAPVSLQSLHRAIVEIGYGRYDMPDGNLESKYVFSDHLGIVEVWDTYLLKLLKNKSEYARRIYATKRHFSNFASAVYYKDFKLIHYHSGDLKDQLFDLENDPEERENVIDSNRELAHSLVRVA